MKRPFEILSKTFKPQHNEAILSLQYFKQTREQNEKAEEWMGHLRIKVNEFGYNKRDRKPKEQFTNGISDEEMMTKIIRQFTAIEETKS